MEYYDNLKIISALIDTINEKLIILSLLNVHVLVSISLVLVSISLVLVSCIDSSRKGNGTTSSRAEVDKMTGS